MKGLLVALVAASAVLAADAPGRGAKRSVTFQDGVAGYKGTVDIEI